jgi:hypothetical protein
MGKANTLACHDTAAVTAEKSFIVQAPGQIFAGGDAPAPALLASIRTRRKRLRGGNIFALNISDDEKKLF